jgi:hypothetical protein
MPCLSAKALSWESVHLKLSARTLLRYVLNLRVEDPVPDAAVGLVGGVLRLSPVHLHLLHQAIRILLSALLSLVTLEGKVILECLGVP